MSDSSDTLDLGSFEQVEAVPLDPQVWTQNLCALRIRQPDLAESLERVELPST